MHNDSFMTKEAEYSIICFMSTKNSDYTVIYSDDDFVVLNKRSGILIAADRYNEDVPRLDLLAEKEFGKLYAVH